MRLQHVAIVLFLFVVAVQSKERGSDTNYNDDQLNAMLNELEQKLEQEEEAKEGKWFTMLILF